MKELFCLRVDRLSVSYGEQELVFWTNEGPVVYGFDTTGDAVMRYVHVHGVNYLLGEVVTAVDKIHVPDEPYNGRWISRFGYKLTTPKGYTSVFFDESADNPFNGFGKLTPASFDPPEPALLREITQDWHA